MNFYVFMTATISVVQRIPTLWAEIAFNIDPVMLFYFAAQLVWNEVQRLFMHRAIFDCIKCAGLGSGPVFEPAFEHVHNRRLTTADGSHEQQDAFAHLETLSSRFEVLDYPG